MTGPELRLLIKSTGLTVQQAADKIGKTKQTLHLWFKENHIDGDTILLIKKSLEKHLEKKQVTSTQIFNTGEFYIIVTNDERIIKNIKHGKEKTR